MPNATAHRIGATIAVGSASIYSEHKDGHISLKPFAHAALAGACGTLPDILEPALNPNHRRFFHSLGFAGLLGYGAYKLYKWQPEDENYQLLKQIGLVIGAAYLIHLAMDATTPKSLPII